MYQFILHFSTKLFILSHLAEGTDALVLEVKAGNGAIFNEKEKFWELARMFVKTADKSNLKIARRGFTACSVFVKSHA
ncbi:MAG: hypothetical protein ACE5JB_13465 [bacterium]